MILTKETPKKNLSELVTKLKTEFKSRKTQPIINKPRKLC